MTKLWSTIAISAVIFVAGAANSQEQQGRASTEPFAVENIEAIVQLQDAFDVWEPNAVETKLTIPLGDDGTTISRSFLIKPDAVEDTYIAIEDWIGKATRVAPVYSDFSLTKYKPEAECEPGNEGTRATQVTTYQTPSGNCWVETKKFLCASGGFFGGFSWQLQSSKTSDC